MNQVDQVSSRDTTVARPPMMESPFKRARTPSVVETGRQASLETQNQVAAGNSAEEHDEPSTKQSRPGRSVMSHVATEQRRRDKINEGFLALRELIPHKDKMDKATFLQQAVDYIRQLQAVMHQLISLGAVRNLPDELQWSIRMLLPRQGDSAKPGNSEPVQKPSESAFSQMVPSSAYLPYMLQPQQMAMLTQHAQQAKQQAAPEAPKPAPAAAPAPAPAPAPAANAVDMNQLQALLQQQQQHQLQAQQAARAGMWPDQSSLWQLAQLQQMMQGQAQQMPACGMNQDTLNAFAQAQLLQSMFSQAAGAVPVPQAAPAPAPIPAMTVSQPAPANEGCGGGAPPQQFCMGASGSLPPAAPKARKSNAKVRKHTSAAKIAKPEAVRPGAAQPPGRPDALSIMHG